jgi:hypothetical protein
VAPRLINRPLKHIPGMAGMDTDPIVYTPGSCHPARLKLKQPHDAPNFMSLGVAMAGAYFYTLRWGWASWNAHD